MSIKKSMRIFIQIIGYSLIMICLNTVVIFAQPGKSQNPNSSSTNQPGVIAEDTVLNMRMNDSLSSKTSRVGDKFSATVTTPIYVDGKVVIPAGAIVEGKVTQVTPARRMNKGGSIAVEFEEIILPNGMSTKIDGVLTSDDPEIQKRIDEENRMSGGKSKDTGIFVGQSGAIGAVLGGITGGGKGAVVGGAVGAGVGLASVLFSKGEEAAVPAGSSFGIRLKQALPVPDDVDAQTDPTQVPSVDNRNRPSPDDSRKVTDPDPTISNSSPPNVEANSKDSNTPDDEHLNSDQLAISDLPLSSPEMIQRAQQALKEKGYYEGDLNGEMTPRTQQALTTYQRENRLPDTGLLDLETARSLDIIGKKAGLKPVQPEIKGNSRVPSETPLPRENNGRPQAPSINGSSRELIQSATKIQSLSAALLAEYQALIGARVSENGVELDNGGKQTDGDIDLLFALDSFANSASLFNRMAPSLKTATTMRNATLSLAREARRTDKVMTSTSSRWANELTPKWDNLRQEILKVMSMFNINVSELDSE